MTQHTTLAILQQHARRLPRDQHTISRKKISTPALKVLYRLLDGGFDAFLVGGCVRDLLLGVQPKDFDIVTNATPQQIKQLFKNSRIIGRRFRLVHILFGREIIEVATFRAPHEHKHQPDIANQSQTGLILRDNVYGTIQEDALRRDFTINALYYNIKDFSVYDFVHGLDDLHQGQLKLIGEPDTRYHEDPVRMLRALRFTNKLSLTMDQATSEPIRRLAPLLADIPAARLFDEVLKMLLSPQSSANLALLKEHQIMKVLFPLASQALYDPHSYESLMAEHLCLATEKRMQEQRSLNPAFLFAALLWYPMLSKANEIMQEASLPIYDAYSIATSDVLAKQSKRVTIPKHFALMVREIWLYQLRLQSFQRKRSHSFLHHARFRAAYDFLLLRQEVEHDQELQPAIDFWTQLQEKHPVSEHSRKKPPATIKKRRHRKKRSRPPSDSRKV